MNTNTDNRIKIEYQKTSDGKIKLVSVSGMSFDKVEQKYGNEVKRIYCESDVYVDFGTINFIIYQPQYTRCSWVHKGDVLEKETFTKYIKLIRQAGDNLRNCIKAVKNYETKTIII